MNINQKYEKLLMSLQRLQDDITSLGDEINPPPKPPSPPEPLPVQEPNDEAVVVVYTHYKNKPPELVITAHPVYGKTPMGLLWRKEDNTPGFDKLKNQLQALLAPHLET